MPFHVNTQYYLLFLDFMVTNTANLRAILAANIKKQRKILGISQEKLAEEAGLSWKMINSIEGHRTWISDKTLENLAMALQMEAWQLLFPTIETQRPPQSPIDTLRELRKIKRNFDTRFNELIDAAIHEVKS
jgi:transcriptional regulator with XRE-family HTH domain